MLDDCAQNPATMATRRSRRLWLLLAFLMMAGGLCVVSQQLVRRAFVSSPTPLSVPLAWLSIHDGRLHRQGQSHPFTGVMAEHYPTGALKSRSELSNGLLQGVSEGWNTNRVLLVRERFLRGVSHGTREKWHANGKRLSISEIVHGKLHGTFQRWHEDGTLAEAIEMKDGVPHGTSRVYYPSGCLQIQALVENGVVVARTNWSDGQMPAPSAAVSLK